MLRSLATILCTFENLIFANSAKIEVHEYLMQTYIACMAESQYVGDTQQVVRASTTFDLKGCYIIMENESKGGGWRGECPVQCTFFLFIHAQASCH